MGDDQTLLLSDNEKLARLQLIRTNKIGPATYSRLLSLHGSAINALEHLAKDYPKLKPYDEGLACTEFEKHAHNGASIIFYGEPKYPPRLAAISDAPPVLSIKGHLNIASKQNIGVVGARNASAAGLKLTRKICSELSGNNIIITSGLARGIDTAAHNASLKGGTIACLAGGLDIIYPPENQRLYDEIAEEGLLISEMPLGTKPQARHFPRRNRIISGLCEGLLVIEAARKSGSLITARFAADQGRDVFSIPGSPLDPRAQGTNQLIKDGAILTQSAEDILSELHSMPLLRARVQCEIVQPAAKIAEQTEPQIVQKTASKNSLLSYLSPDPIHIDEIVRLSSTPAEKILGEFITLELTGEIMRHSGNRFSRISSKNE